MKITKSKIFRLIIFSLFLFLSLEISLRIYFTYISKNLCFGTFGEINFLKTYNKEKGDIIRYDPLKGWDLLPNSSGEYEGGAVKINNQGFRDDKDYTLKRSDKIRIAFLGDSYTFGEEVDNNETFIHFLSQSLPNIELLNMGVPSYSHDQILLMLKDKLIKYKPDIVILGYFEADKYRNMTNFYCYEKPYFSIANKELKLKNVPVPSPHALFNQIKYRSRLLDSLKIIKEEAFKKTPFYNKKLKDTTSSILDEIINTSLENDIFPIFIFLPDNLDLFHGTNNSRYFLNYCESRKAFCLSLYDKLLTQTPNKKYFLRKRGHWSKETNSIAAEIIKIFLVKNGLLNKKRILYLLNEYKNKWDNKKNSYFLWDGKIPRIKNSRFKMPLAL